MCNWKSLGGSSSRFGYLVYTHTNMIGWIKNVTILKLDNDVQIL